ncbi:MAG TPA: gas vesicle protein [Gemmatimonadaceae bacterium]|jgi:hypothetical protein|nr:gas vesicle protein [Gemmatimonadaceae bacterium]
MAGDELGPIESEERLVLGEMLNHVLDKGVVIAGDITISVADIDLIRLGISLYLTSVETLERSPGSRGDLPVLSD